MKNNISHCFFQCNTNTYYNQGYAEGLAENVHGEISYVRHSHSEECYVSCTVKYTSILESHSGDGNPCSACGATATRTQKWGLSHSACGITGDATTWFICASCGKGKPQNTGTGSVHNALKCGKAEGQIVSATIVYP